MSKQEVAIVTGAGRGIGRGIALALAGLGWRIVINFKGNAPAAQQTLEDVRAAGGDGLTVQGDVANGTDRLRLVAETLGRYGRIDMLVNNAGMAPRVRTDVLEMSEESYDEVMAANLKGPFLLTQRVAQEMIRLVEQGTTPRPKIVNISSVSAYASGINRGEYCLSKAGMSMMTKLFADRLAAHGILVYEIRPGVIETDMTGVPAVKARYDRLILQEKIQPLARWGRPDDVGRAVSAIAQDLFPFSTGQIFDVDGGFHLKRL